jgi:hypothetical protein
MSLSSITPHASASAAATSRAGGAAAARRDAAALQPAADGPQAGPRPWRAALTDTLAAADATGGVDLAGGAVRDALADFSGELFDALRADSGREVGHGPGRHLQRGHAWGHYRGGDLAARIEALAATLGAGGAAPVEPVPDAAAPAEVAPDGAAPAEADAEPLPAEEITTEAPPPPLAASPLEASFAALWQALNPDAADTAAADLASFLNALAERLGGSAPAPVGGLVDTTA